MKNINNKGCFFIIKNKGLMFCMSTLLLSSCSKNFLFNKDQALISKELKLIKNADQASRNYTDLVDIKYSVRTFYTVADSLYNERNGNIVPDYDFNKIPSLSEQLLKMDEVKRKSYEEEKNEANLLLNYVDVNNRKKLVKIIDRYGYPSFYNRIWKDTTELRVGMTFVLTHVDESSIEGRKMLDLMIKEYNKGRVNEREMKQYLWSLDGRLGNPYDYIIDLAYWKRKLADLKRKK